MDIKRLNNKGVALITAYFVMAALITLSAGFALTTFSELGNAKRYYNSAAAFWLAEGGINNFIHSNLLLDSTSWKTIAVGNNPVTLTKDDSHPAKRIVTATATVNGIKRSVQVEYAANAPDVFTNALSTNGNILITGNKSTLAFNNKTRISGRTVNTSAHSSVFFEDKIERVAPASVSLIYPDADNNGKADEFDDFVQFNRNLIASYPKSEVLYIRGDDTYTITPNSSLAQKKIVYVEGGHGKGNVLIQLGPNLEDGQNLTLIATGKVTFNQAGILPNSAQLNIISWGGYSETAALPATHYGTIFTHGIANFEEIHDTSVTNGSVIANSGITIREVWSSKTFNYFDTRTKGVVPPGFEGLLGDSKKGYEPIPYSWKEI